MQVDAEARETGRPSPASAQDGELSVRAAVDELAATLGPTGVSRSRATRLAYGRDAYPVAIREALRGADRYEPDAVAWPTSGPEVAAVLGIARRHGLGVVPYGAGSGIVGGALAGPGRLVIDLKRLNRLIAIDPIAMTATVEAGILGKDLEDALNANGLTCGHYPQSLFSSTVGGWVAHRGVGTFSTRYGKIDDLVLGLQAVLADGTVVDAKTEPQSAAGPDLKRIFLGSEGTLGIITRVTLQVFPLPESRRFVSFGCPTFADGLDAVRRVVQAGYRPAAVRLYDSVEARERLAADTRPGESLLIGILEGPAMLVDATEVALNAIARELRLTDLGDGYGQDWLRSRFSTSGLVSTIEQPTGIADALEVANTWSRLPETYERMKAAMEHAVGGEGRVYGHASHFYHSGANLYMIFHTAADSPEDVETRYREVLSAAFDACLATGATLTHHHGVGLGKRDYLRAELGPGGLEVLARLRRALDPDGLLNPGKLVDDGH